MWLVNNLVLVTDTAKWSSLSLLYFISQVDSLDSQAVGIQINKNVTGYTCKYLFIYFSNETTDDHRYFEPAYFEHPVISKQYPFPLA